jgi:hypothetical protein
MVYDSSTAVDNVPGLEFLTIIPEEDQPKELFTSFQELKAAYKSGDMQRVSRAIVDIIAAFIEFVHKIKASGLDVLDSINDSQLEAEINELKKIKEEVEASHKAEKAGIFSKIMQIFSIMVSAIAMLIVPSPLTVALFIVTLAMTVEPMIADLAGYESLTGQLMESLTGLIDKLPISDVGKAVLNAIIIIAVFVAVVLILKTGFSMITPPPMPQAIVNFQNWLIGNGANSYNNLAKLTNQIELGFAMVSNTSQIIPAFFLFKAENAKLDAEVIRNMIDWLEGNKEILMQYFDSWKGLEDLFNKALETLKSIYYN